MKTYYAIALLFLSTFGHLQSGPINDPIISMVDGSMLDGNKIKNIINFLVELRRLLHGTKNPTTQLFEGVIVVNKERYSIDQLASIENECNQQDCEPSECDCPIKKDDLQKALVQAIVMFERAHMISQKDAKGTKQMSQRLIRAWAEQNNKNQDIYLLRWTEIPESQEQESFKAAITSFVELKLFLEDLASFLKDLVSSCPKAYQQYKISLKQDAQRTKL